MKIKLSGDKSVASKYIGVARQVLNRMGRNAALGLTGVTKKTIPLGEALIFVDMNGGFPIIEITGEGGGDIIIAHLGDATPLYEKRYFDLNGRELQRGPWRIESGAGDGTQTEITIGGQTWHIITGGSSSAPAGWSITDDGKYAAVGAGVPHDDPLDYEYLYEYPGGAGVPEVFNGAAAIKKQGKTVRVILNQSMEDELWVDYEKDVGGVYQYNQLWLEDSLIFAPYWVKGKPFVSRYTDDGVVTMTQIWDGMDTTLSMKGYGSVNFEDRLPQVSRIYYTPLDSTTGSRSYVEIVGNQVGVAPPLSCATNYYSDKRLTQSVVRWDTLHALGSNDFAEPGKEEIYALSGGAGVPTGVEFHRNADPTDTTNFFQYDSIIKNVSIDPATGVLLDSGLSYFSNDVKRPYAILEDGSQTYVRLRKDAEMTEWASSVYVAGELIEDSGFEPVEKLYHTGRVEVNGPIYIRKTSHQILHAHHGEKFDAALYRTTRYVTHSSQLLPYTFTRTDTGDTVQVRQTSIESETTYTIVVNGVKYPLPDYTAYNTEHQITGLSTAYGGPPVQDVSAYHQAFPWVDTSSDSVNITRIFMNEQKNLLIGFDVYESYVRHDLTHGVHSGFDTLEAVYDDSVWPFPPASDSLARNPVDRKWLLFNEDGSLKKEITPPKKDISGVRSHWPRVNGLCLLQA